MTTAHVVTGTLTDGKTLVLDEALPAIEGKVRVTVEVVRADSPLSFLQVMEQIWDGQRRRGHVPRTRAAVDAQIREERESWGE